MVKLTTFILILTLSFQNSCNNSAANLQTVKFVVNNSQKGTNEWFEIIEQFLSKGHEQKSTSINSSAYLCIRLATKDTVWVLTPYESLKYKDGIKAQLYFDDNVKVGDTLSFQLTSELYSSYLKHSKVVGTLKIPTN
jgi:hypothetical protein